jgi:hypothetical protein
MSCQKLQMWHPTSLYGFRLKGITGMKQNVNHSQRLDTLFWLVSLCLWVWVLGKEGKTYRPLKFPQFWHCTVMCSAPLSADVKARGVVLVGVLWLLCGEGRTVCSAGEEEEHGRGLMCGYVGALVLRGRYMREVLLVGKAGGSVRGGMRWSD